MKAVLISIQPKWCELIASGKKTVEVRKTKPKIDVPFKCYIYCTKDYSLGEFYTSQDDFAMPVQGKIIGEFVCECITYLGNISTDNWAYLIGWSHEYCKRLITNNACLTEEELLKYGGKYAWHISDLVIYDKPKELREFVKPCNYKNDCCACDRYDYIGKKCYNEITRPPQSWCYVEEVDR